MDFYTHVADKLLNGGVLYRDAIDTKPPAIFFHYAVVFRLFGENNLAAVKFVTLGIVALTAAGVAGIWRELQTDDRGRNAELARRGRSVSAALLFLLATFSGWGEEFLSSNTEVLANLFIIGGVYCLVWKQFGRDPRWLTIGGALLGVAFLYRFQSGAALAAYAFLLLLQRRAWLDIVTRLLWIATGFALPTAAVVAGYAAIGSLPSLADFLRYDYFYLRGGGIYWPALLSQVAIVLVGQVHFLVLAGWEAARIVRARQFSQANTFLGVWLLCSLAAFLAGGRFFAHYFIQAIPPVVLLATQRLTAIDVPQLTVGWFERLASAYRRLAPALIVAHVLIFAVVNAVFLWRTREPENTHLNLVRFAQAHTTKHDRIYVWTSRTHVLFEMDRVYATRFISNDFLVGRMYGTRHRRASATAGTARVAAVPELWPLLMHDLESDPPPLVIDDTKDRSSFTLDHYPELQAFVERNYQPCLVIDGFCVYVRKETGIRD
jgi:4-amino-4-deoxy-L-arabinose transferase-like glycosyltransferase